MKLPIIKPAEKVFLQFCEAYKNRDLDFVLSLFTENANLWGTALDEYRRGLHEIEEQIKRDWSQSEKGELEVVSFVPAPNAAMWAAAICNAKMVIAGKVQIFPHLRATILIEKDQEEWRMSHMHASFPDYRNAEDASFPSRD